MPSIKCPLCNESLSADAPATLSQSLKEHLYDTHELKVIDEVARWNAQPQNSPNGRKEIDEVTRFSGEVSESPSSKKQVDSVTRWDSGEADSPKGRKQIENVTQFTKDAPVGSTPESSKLIEVVTRFKGEYPGGCAPECQDLIEETTKFQKPSGAEKPGAKGKASHGTSVISCPFCDTVVRGKDDSDLSINLRDHISASHKVN